MTMRTDGKLGIVFALPEEARGLTDVLAQSRLIARKSHGRHEWAVGSLQLVMEVSGIGRKRCAEATARLIDAGAQWIVCAGFAAALDESLAVGDIVVADRVLSRNGSQAVACSKGLIEAVPPSGTLGYVIHRGGLITSDSLVCRAEEKRAVHTVMHAQALDMESHGAGEVCARSRVPFLAVRAISDTAGQTLCPALEQLISGDSAARRAWFALSHPVLWPQLHRLKKQAHKAAANLGDVLGVMVLRII